MKGYSTPKKSFATPKKNRNDPGDRFIPSRKAMDMDIANFNLTSSSENTNPNVLLQSPSKELYKESLAKSLFDSSSAKSMMSGSKVLAFKHKAPAPSDTYENRLRILYSQNKMDSQLHPRVSRKERAIPSAPERVLDAPNLVDNYYLNLLDWSSTNVLAIALSQSIYLWNATTSEITELMTLDEENPSNIVTSLSWTMDGNALAVGTEDAQVQLWDVNHGVKLRTLKGHEARVGSMSWNQSILSTGSRSGMIFNSDVRQAQHRVSVLQGHTQEVCGLQWSKDGSQLASGGNDNLLNIWEPFSSSSTGNPNEPRFTFDDHMAAVKAVAWCPFQYNLLATGGGTTDRCIKFWNTKTGTLLNSVDTHSQVCSLVWSKTHRELVSSHGFSENQLTVWKYPSLVKVTELRGHTQRVLHMAMSPDGETVVSAGADERLKFWKVWPAKSTTATEKNGAVKASALTGKDGCSSSSTNSIRVRNMQIR
ncbi:ubiquitin-protein transferase activating protein [Balamuthia mandrillaris]